MEIVLSQAESTYSLEPLHDGRPVHGVRFNQEILASVGFDGSIHLWDIASELDNICCQRVISCSKRPLLQVDFSSNGKVMAAACADGFIYVGDVETATRDRLQVLKGHESYVNGVCKVGGSNDQLFLSSSEDSTVRMWDCSATNQCATVFELPREATSVTHSALMPNQVLCGSLDNAIRCFDVRSPAKPLYTLQGHKDTVTGLSLSPQTGRELLSIALDGTIRMWDVSPFSSERLLHVIPHGRLNGEEDYLRVAHTPTGKAFSGGSGRGSEFTVCMWDSKCQPLKAFPGHVNTVIEVSFHASQNMMASCGMDGKLLVGTYC